MLVTGTIVSVLFGFAAWIALGRLDDAFPPPLDQSNNYSAEVFDRNGKHLRIFTNSSGRFRLKTHLDEVDDKFIRMLISYEDKRFYGHFGVDPLALLRSAAQLLSNGRIVSGGSTLTMQLARLLEPRQKRSISGKLRQMLRALQIERRLSKEQILELYLTLAPYGGNIEGIRAGSLSWFGKEPRKLELREAALLVALPQSPERRRPDKHPDIAQSARDLVLKRIAESKAVIPGEVNRVAALAVPQTRINMPMLAIHLTHAARDRNPKALAHKSTVDSKLQSRMEKLTRSSARRLGSRTSAAIVVADSVTGDILASAGSAGLEESARKGWIDMTWARRSPGSTLKPFVYGLAIEDGLVLPSSMISDRPSDFGGYRPTNFDRTYQGDITVRRALQMSLNVPSVKLLEAVSPARLVSRLERTGVKLQFPQGEYPGLGLVLGGTGVSLTELVQLYANLISNSEVPVALGDGIRNLPGPLAGRKLLSRVATWHVMDMLSGVREPTGSRPLAIAYKTGTSYGFRDAWSIGFDGKHVIGVWVGRADNGPVPGITGIKTAAPILFEAFEKSGLKLEPFPRPPEGAIRQNTSELPISLRQFVGIGSVARLTDTSDSNKLRVAFPINGHELEMPHFADGTKAPIVVKLQGGVPPFRLIEDKKLVEQIFRTREILWEPESKGTTTIAIVDSIGQAQTVSLRVR